MKSHGTSLPIPPCPARSGYIQPTSKLGPQPQTSFHPLPLTPSGKASSHLQWGQSTEILLGKECTIKSSLGTGISFLLKPRRRLDSALDEHQHLCLENSGCLCMVRTLKHLHSPSVQAPSSETHRENVPGMQSNTAPHTSPLSSLKLQEQT